MGEEFHPDFVAIRFAILGVIGFESEKEVVCTYVNVWRFGNMYTREHGRAYSHVHMPTWYLGLNIWPDNYLCVLDCF